MMRQNLLPFVPMKTEANIRILLVDDHAIIRAATRLLLNTCKIFTIVGEAADGAAGVKMALQLKPDVVLMDINMKPVSGIQATRRLLSRLPDVLVIGFSALPNKYEEKEMIDAGAKVVIHKNAPNKYICQRIVDFYQQHADSH